MQHGRDSLRDFFGADDEGLKSRVYELLDGDELRSFREDVTAKLPTLQWPGAAGEIAAKTTDLLDMPLSGILFKVWNRAGILKKYVDPEKYGPDEVFLVELLDHTVKSTHRPYIDIRVNETPVRKIEFDVVLELAVHAVVLKVQDAKIRAIQTGSVKGSGKLSWQGLVLGEKKDVTLDLPGTVELGEGVPIAP